MTPRDAASGHLGSVPIRLYRFHTPTRPRWAARIDVAAIGSPEAYGATPDEALRALAALLTIADIEALRRHTEANA
ncbi:MAG TPA: hypothetical protein VN213_13525 [Solirubrobacteraceae bacterium]|nr:hypothetical protein [Solirubrobacteraceae bacterium]